MDETKIDRMMARLMEHSLMTPSLADNLGRTRSQMKYGIDGCLSIPIEIFEALITQALSSLTSEDL